MKEGDEIRHEGVDGYCRRFAIVVFWIARAARTIAHGVRKASFASTVTWPGVKEGNEIRREGTDEYCR